MKEKITRFKNHSHEEGLSLVEILVAISLLAVISIMVVTLINSTMNSSSRFANVTSSQNEVSTAASNIQKDLSNAQRVLKATNNSITVLVRQNNQDSEVTYFYYDRSNPGTLPAGVDNSKLPAYSAIISLRKAVSTGNVGQTTIVKQVNFEGFSSVEKQHMFDYYNQSNSEISVPASTSGTSATANTLSNIKRVEFRIAAEAEGRGTPIQVESSATVNSSLVSPSGGTPDSYTSIPECPTNFRVTINPDTDPTTAVLNWYAPAGATSYTIYRTNESTGTADPTTTVSDPTTTSLTVPNLLWGTTYRWNIQSNGPGGISPICTPGTTGTVVPAEIGFSNVNSLASISTTKTGSTAETLNRAADGGIPAKNVSTTYVEAGQRYTVARGLVNQLAWESTYGTEGYRLYESANLTSPVAEITNAGTRWTRIDTLYGDNKQYIVRAYNAGGESPVSFPVRLISPPLSSPFTVVDPDTSTRSTTTDSNITVSNANRAAETTGFRVQKNEAAVAASVDLCSPSSWSNPSSNLNFTNTTTSDANAAWGNSSCYRLTPFNDAGNGVPSTNTVDHKPGKFSFTNITNPSLMRIIDTGRNLNGGGGGLGLPYCWNDRNGNAGSLPADLNCKGDGTAPRGDAYSPVGMFGSISNTRLEINVVWNSSNNAFKDYRVTRERRWSANTVDQNATTSSTHSAAYVNGSQSLLFRNEQPGSIFRFTVRANAENGTYRDRTTEHLSRPDIPHSFRSNYWVKDFGNYNGTSARTTVYTGTMRGGVDTIISTFDMSGRLNNPQSQRNSITGTYRDVDSPYQTLAGKNQRFITSELTANISVEQSNVSDTSLRVVSSTKQSEDIGRYGEITGFSCPSGSGSCYDQYGKPFPDGWPLWWTGSPARYWSGGSAISGSVSAGSTAAVDAPGMGMSQQPESNQCSTKQEDAPTFVSTCEYGTGIPAVPNVSDTISGTNHAISWNQWPEITKYEVTYRINGGATTTLQRTPSQRTLSLSIPIGQSATVTVKAFNEVGSSTATYTATTPPAVPTNVSATPSGTTAVVSWGAVPNATGYRVEYTRVGTTTTQTVNATSTSQTLTGLTAGSTYQVRVVALAGVVESAKSAVVSVSIGGPPVAPATPTVNATAGTLTASWNGVSNATSYVVRYKVGTGAQQTVEVTGTSTNITITTGGAYTVAVSAKNASGSSAYSANATGTAPAPAALLGAPNGISHTSAANGSNFNLTLNWTPVNGATGYVVRYLDSSNTTTTVQVNSGTATGTTISNLPPDVYRYSVATKNNAGTGAFTPNTSVVLENETVAGPAITNISVYPEFQQLYYADFDYVSSTSNPAFTLVVFDSEGQVVYLDTYQPSAASGTAQYFGFTVENPGTHYYEIYATSSDGGEKTYTGTFEVSDWEN